MGVTNYGMSEIGPWSLQDEGAQSQDMIMRMMSRNNTSEKLLEQIDDAVKKVSDEAYATALKQISDNREAMAEVVVFGEDEVTTGASGDHQLDSPPRPPPASVRPLRGAS